MLFSNLAFSIQMKAQLMHQDAIGSPNTDEEIFCSKSCLVSVWHSRTELYQFESLALEPLNEGTRLRHVLESLAVVSLLQRLERLFIMFLDTRMGFQNLFTVRFPQRKLFLCV